VTKLKQIKVGSLYLYLTYCVSIKMLSNKHNTFTANYS